MAGCGCGIAASSGLGILLQSIVPVHKILLGTFTERPGSTEIARVFREQREGLLLYGSYAAKLPLAVAKVSLPYCI